MLMMHPMTPGQAPGVDKSGGALRRTRLRGVLGAMFLLCLFDAGAGVRGGAEVGSYVKSFARPPCTLSALRGGKKECEHSQEAGGRKRPSSPSAARERDTGKRSQKRARMECASNVVEGNEPIGQKHLSQLDVSDVSAAEHQSWDWSEDCGPAQPRQAATVLADEGPGARIMKKMGFDGGALGRSGKGIVEPVAATTAGVVTGREGVGLRPVAQQVKKGITQDVLFSDSSNALDENTNAHGSNRQAKRAWDKKLRRAMGGPENKPGKRERKPKTLAGYVSAQFTGDTPSVGEDDERDGEGGRDRRARPPRAKGAGKAGKSARHGVQAEFSDADVQVGDEAFAQAFDAKYGPAGESLKRSGDRSGNDENSGDGEEIARGGEGEDGEAGGGGAQDEEREKEGGAARVDWKQWDSVTRDKAAERFARVEHDMGSTTGKVKRRAGAERAASKSPNPTKKGKGNSGHGFFGRRNRPAEESQAELEPVRAGAVCVCVCMCMRVFVCMCV